MDTDYRIIYLLYQNNFVHNINQLSPAASVIKYITGYLIELSLSVDNLFVIAVIFSSYKIPAHYQHRLLFSLSLPENSSNSKSSAFIQ